MAVAVLDSFVELTGTLSPSAGSNRFLLIFQHVTGNSVSISAASFGGESMTLEEQIVDNTVGFPTHMFIWSLNEAGIAAAGASSSFSIDTGSTNGGDERTAVVLSGVDQVSPVVATADGAGNVAGVPAFNLSTVADGYAAAGAMYDHDAGTDTLSWGADLTERINLQTSARGNTYSTADTLTDGSTVSVSVSTPQDTAGDEQKCAAAISLRPAVTIKNVAATLAGTGDLTAGSVKALVSAAVLAGQGDLSAASLKRLISSAAISGTGEITAADLKRAQIAAQLAGTGDILAGTNKVELVAPADQGAGGGNNQQPQMTMDDIAEEFQKARDSLTAVDDADLEAILPVMAQMVVRSLT